MDEDTEKHLACPLFESERATVRAYSERDESRRTGWRWSVTREFHAPQHVLLYFSACMGRSIVWTASMADEPASADLDPMIEPNVEDCGGERTSSFLATPNRLLRDDPLAIRAHEFGREDMPLNMAFGVPAC